MTTVGDLIFQAKKIRKNQKKYTKYKNISNA
jgi:hypothetical protein